MEERNEEKVAHWREIIEAQVKSEMSAAAFCRQRGVSIHNFHYWRKRLNGPVKKATPDLFVRLDTVRGTSSAGVTLLTGAYRLELAEDFSQPTLMRALAVLAKC
tara:strand:+ start:195 stop:506 length:312 start_codon:yes stop_codon:yes gene_type:complete